MITVLLAAYEGKRYIREQLDSILNQTLPDIRIMVSDDGSADGTREIIEEYESRYPERIMIRNRQDSPFCGAEDMDKRSRVPAAARNFFWLLSQTEGEEYLMFSDQDDVWKPEKAEKLLARMKEIEGKAGKAHPILIHSDMEVTDEHLSQISPSFFEYQKCDPERTSFAEVLVENPVTGGAAMINGALADLLRKPPKACFMHDWWMALAASCFGTISFVDEPLYFYRQHSSNTLGAKKTGSIKDLRERAGRNRQVRENYRKMFAQAAAFGRQFGSQMDSGQKAVLHSFLTLPLQSPAGRLRNIRRNHFYKSSAIQTLAMCVTIPGRT